MDQQQLITRNQLAMIRANKALQLQNQQLMQQVHGNVSLYQDNLHSREKELALWVKVAMGIAIVMAIVALAFIFTVNKSLNQAGQAHAIIQQQSLQAQAFALDTADRLQKAYEASDQKLLQVIKGNQEAALAAQKLQINAMSAQFKESTQAIAMAVKTGSEVSGNRVRNYSVVGGGASGLWMLLGLVFVVVLRRAKR